MGKPFPRFLRDSTDLHLETSSSAALTSSSAVSLALPTIPETSPSVGMAHQASHQGANPSAADTPAGGSATASPNVPTSKSRWPNGAQGKGEEEVMEVNGVGGGSRRAAGRKGESQSDGQRKTAKGQRMIQREAGEGHMVSATSKMDLSPICREIKNRPWLCATRRRRSLDRDPISATAKAQDQSCNSPIDLIIFR